MPVDLICECCSRSDLGLCAIFDKVKCPVKKQICVNRLFIVECKLENCCYIF